MSKNIKEEAPVQNINILSSGTMIIGDLKVDGDIRIDGNVNGKIQVKGKLILGSSSHVEGDITCHQADIAGQVKGKIQAKEVLILRNTAKIDGEIFTQKINIEIGAIFNGNCSMSTTLTISQSLIGSREKPQ